MGNSIGDASAAVRAANRDGEQAIGQVSSIIDNLERQRAALMQAAHDTNQADAEQAAGYISSIIDHFDQGRSMIQRGITMVEDVANRL